VTCYAVVLEKKSKMFQLIRDQGSYLAFDSHQIVTTFLQNLNKGTFLANLVPLHAVVVEKKYKKMFPPSKMAEEFLKGDPENIRNPNMVMLFQMHFIEKPEIYLK
jgi:hypothetical protein